MSEAITAPASGKVDRYEEWAAVQPQVPIVTRHYFAPGIYAREIVVPAGIVITGAQHQTKYLAVLSKGSVSVWQEGDATKATLLTAPMTVVSEVGARRIGVVHEEMIWTDFFPNPDDDRDVDRIMERLVIWPAARQIVLNQSPQCLPS